MWQAREENRKRARDGDKMFIDNLQKEVAALQGEICWWRTWWWQQQATHCRTADKSEDNEIVETPMKLNRPDQPNNVAKNMELKQVMGQDVKMMASKVVREHGMSEKQRQILKGKLVKKELGKCRVDAEQQSCLKARSAATSSAATVRTATGGCSSLEAKSSATFSTAGVSTMTGEYSSEAWKASTPSIASESTVTGEVSSLVESSATMVSSTRTVRLGTPSKGRVWVSGRR